jgi:hypothetical protein
MSLVKKTTQNVAPPHFCKFNTYLLPWKKKPKLLDCICIFKKVPKINNHPMGKNLAKSGHPATVVLSFDVLPLKIFDRV